MPGLFDVSLPCEAQWPIEISLAFDIPAWTDVESFGFEDPALMQAQSVPWTEDRVRIQKMAAHLNALCDKLEVTMKRDWQLKIKFESEARKIEVGTCGDGIDAFLLERKRILLGWAKAYENQIPVYHKACVDLVTMLGGLRKCRPGYRGSSRA